MRVGDLLTQLENYPEDWEVKIVFQPNYPLIAPLLGAVGTNETLEDLFHEDGEEHEGPKKNYVILVRSEQIEYASDYDSAAFRMTGN